jgi:hypothetical protein
MDHIREAKKVFDQERIYYLPVPESELLRMESEMIRRLQPRYNGDSRGNGRLARTHPDSCHTCQSDPDLALVNAAWSGLPESVRAAVMMLVRAASK